MIVSMDLKTVKLIDFGISTRLDTTAVSCSQANCGTYRFMPPEQLSGILSLKSDIWSFGCIVLQLCTF